MKAVAQTVPGLVVVARLHNGSSERARARHRLHGDRASSQHVGRHFHAVSGPPSWSTVVLRPQGRTASVSDFSNVRGLCDRLHAKHDRSWAERRPQTTPEATATGSPSLNG